MFIYLSERNQQLLRDGGGVEALIELLTKEQVPEQQQTALSIKDLIYGVKVRLENYSHLLRNSRCLFRLPSRSTRSISVKTGGRVLPL